MASKGDDSQLPGFPIEAKVLVTRGESLHLPQSLRDIMFFLLRPPMGLLFSLKDILTKLAQKKMGFHPMEYREILMDEGSSSVGTSGFIRLKIASPSRSEFESGQPHVDNCAEDFQSQQKSNSSPVKLDSVISDPTEGLENESYSRDPTVEEDNNISAVMDEVVYDTQVDTSRGVLLACELHSKSTDDLSKVGLDKINSSLEILSRTEGRARTRSMNNLEMKQKDKKSARISVGEKMRSKFVSSMGFETVEKVAPVGCEPDQGRNNWNFEAFEFHRCTDKKKLSEFRTPKVKNKGNIKKAKTKATRSMGMAAAADKQEDNVTPDMNNVPDNAKSSGMKTRRKLEYQTPDREKVEVASPQCMSFKRSRSGRLLMPTLEFWRNQRAVYGSDRTITGIEEGRINPDPQRKVEKVAPVGCEPDQGRNNWNFEAFEFHSCTDKKKLSEFGTPKVKNKGSIKKAKTKATRSMSMAAAADKQEDNVTPDMNNVPNNANSSGMKTRRKLEYQTPDREKVEVASPQCMSFKRSGSGRLLMPTLEFWRNQKAVYGSDRTITGIEEGRINPDPQRKGKRG